MKKWMIFVAGLIAGFLLAFVIDQITSKSDGSKETKVVNNEVEAEAEEEPSLYDGFENGEIVDEDAFKVLQVLADNVALAYGRDKSIDFEEMFLGVVYLLIGPEGTHYYDDQIVRVPKGKVVRMNGTYQYETRNGSVKTVPRVMIMDK